MKSHSVQPPADRVDHRVRDPKIHRLELVDRIIEIDQALPCGISDEAKNARHSKSERFGHPSAPLFMTEGQAFCQIVFWPFFPRSGSSSS